MNNEEELLQLKTKIDEDIKKQSESKIKEELTLEALKNDFDCNNLEEAKKYLIEVQIAKKDLQKQLESGIISLKKELGIE